MHGGSRRILLVLVVASFVGLSLGSASAGFTVVVPRPPRLDEEPSVPDPEASVKVNALGRAPLDNEALNNACPTEAQWPAGLTGTSNGTLGDGQGEGGSFDLEDWSKLRTIRSEMLIVELSPPNRVQLGYHLEDCDSLANPEAIPSTGFTHLRVAVGPGVNFVEPYSLTFHIQPNDAGQNRDAAEDVAFADTLEVPLGADDLEVNGGLRANVESHDHDWYRLFVGNSPGGATYGAGLLHVRFTSECASEAPLSTVRLYDGQYTDALGTDTPACDVASDFLCVYAGYTSVLVEIVGEGHGYNLQASNTPLQLIESNAIDWYEFIVDESFRPPPPEIAALIEQVRANDQPQTLVPCGNLDRIAFADTTALTERAQFIINTVFNLIEEPPQP
jgi:hypothetical protein